MNKIVWLASYPKSGNTWMRALLSNYLSEKNDPADINQLQTDGISTARSEFDDFLEINSTELDNKVIDLYRPKMFQQLARRTEKALLLLKTHEIYHHNSVGQPIFPTDVSKAAIYIVRDPRDVVVSYAHHIGKTISQTIDILNNLQHKQRSRIKLYDEQFPNLMSDWSSHYRSWTEQADIPCVVVRYEEMLTDTKTELARVCDLIGLEWDIAKAEQAIENSSFEKLRDQEQKNGFKERSKHNTTFFRNGTAGDWKEKLTLEEVERVTSANGVVMRELGYL